MSQIGDTRFFRDRALEIDLRSPMHRFVLVLAGMVAACACDDAPEAQSPVTARPAAPGVSENSLYVRDFAGWTTVAARPSDSPAMWFYPQPQRSGLTLWLALPSHEAPSADAEVRRFEMNRRVSSATEIAGAARLMLSGVHGTSSDVEAATATAASLPADLGSVPISSLVWRPAATAPNEWAYTVQVEAVQSDEGALEGFHIRIAGTQS